MGTLKIKNYFAFFVLAALFPAQSFADQTRSIPEFVVDFVDPTQDRPLMLGKQYFTGFESLDEFKSFYIVPQDYFGTSNHELIYKNDAYGFIYNLYHRLGIKTDQDNILFGHAMHKAFITGANPVEVGVNTNHRAYPTFQLLNTDLGIVKSAVLIEFWVWVDFQLQSREGKNWISLATFTSYTDNNWAHSYLINMNADGVIHLMHVPSNSMSVHDIYQTHSLTMPMKQWIQITTYIDYQTNNRFKSPFIAVWQDGALASAARFDDRIKPSLVIASEQRPPCTKDIPIDVTVERLEEICKLTYVGGLAQAHFGLYVPPSLSSGTIYNDDLTITEVK
jgi:hypothetical protein